MGLNFKVKKVFKWIICILLIPVFYGVIALLLSSITVNKNRNIYNATKTVYLATNGVHLDIIVPVNELDSALENGLQVYKKTSFLAFGWGDENFYINTPTWADLTFKNAFSALFLNSTSLMHVTQYYTKQNSWVKINITKTEYKKLVNYINQSFLVDSTGAKLMLKNKGYSVYDHFYKAQGSYSCFNTCNTWANRIFKNSGLKACVWTPFDFSLLNKYRD